MRLSNPSYIPMRQLCACLLLTALMMSLTACQTNNGINNGIKTNTYQGGNGRSHDRTEVAKVRTNLAAQYIRENKLDAARQQLELALQSDGRYAPAYDMMGVLLQTEGSSANMRKADEYFRRALSLDADFVQARNNYGVYLSAIGRHADAAKHFEIAGSTLGYDGRALALENLGLVYLRLNQTAKAKESFVRSIEANLNNVSARMELVDILLGENNNMLAKRMYDEMLSLMGSQKLPPRILMQGIKLAIAQNNQVTRQNLAQQLLSLYPLSDEARRLKAWLANPQRPLK